jgi:hypothetical protein
MSSTPLATASGPQIVVGRDSNTTERHGPPSAVSRADVAAVEQVPRGVERPAQVRERDVTAGAAAGDDSSFTSPACCRYAGYW